MFMSTQWKTNDGKWKNKGKKKPLQMKMAKQKLKHLKKKYLSH